MSLIALSSFHSFSCAHFPLYCLRESTRFSLWGVDGWPNFVRWCLSFKHFSVIGHPMASRRLRSRGLQSYLSKQLVHARVVFVCPEWLVFFCTFCFILRGGGGASSVISVYYRRLLVETERDVLWAASCWRHLTPPLGCPEPSLLPVLSRRSCYGPVQLSGVHNLTTKLTLIPPQQYGDMTGAGGTRFVTWQKLIKYHKRVTNQIIIAFWHVAPGKNSCLKKGNKLAALASALLILKNSGAGAMEKLAALVPALLRLSYKNKPALEWEK